MSTTPVTPSPATVPTWITLLINLGANLGASFIKNTKVGELINLAAAEVTAVINQVQLARASGGITANNLVVPLFVDAVLGALNAAVIAGKISPSDAAELSKAVAAMAQEDLIAKTAVDYSTIGTIAPLQ